MGHVKMKRYFYIGNDLHELDAVQVELEANGFSRPQIHVFTEDDNGVNTHNHLNNMEPVLKKDVVYGTQLGAIVGLAASALVILIAWLTGWYNTATWVPFIFLAVVLLGFCTWEGGFLGIQETHHDFKRFKAVIESGKHVFFVDTENEQLPTLTRIMENHPNLEKAGVGRSTPAIVVKAQSKWKNFIQTMP